MSEFIYDFSTGMEYRSKVFELQYIRNKLMHKVVKIRGRNKPLDLNALTPLEQEFLDAANACEAVLKEWKDKSRANLLRTITDDMWKAYYAGAKSWKQWLENDRRTQ